ncbi:protein TIFY 4A-like isoform X2 [Trifolium pratense]|uniref:protein TIFY 4A-like isoform X2 n=1 Tax=Trifolium pratense TaxID=57577 RepID=UPI001E692236|nr:protein TIFY 4A-like isoform X2 [Trifolium pratense]
MNGGTTLTSVRSILDKPLNQLTEDDISQLTREDCRRFLKDKGMRRPSWNKSQAIQQVISLKALLEPTADDLPAPVGVSSAIHHHHHHHPQPPQRNLNEAPAKGADPDDTGFHAVEDLKKSTTSTAAEKATETNDANVVKLSGGCAASGSFGQMTIFYCGKVNVYDGVSPDKAQSIMQLAACPSSFPQDNLLNKNAAVWASPCNIPIDKDVLFPNDTAILQVAQTDKMVEYPLQYREKGIVARDAEGQASRLVSLQRYREKRKDRGRSKGNKLTGITSSNFEMYLNLPAKLHASNGNSSRSSTDSPPQPRLPLVSGGSAENQPKVTLPIDLNDKDVQEC